MPKANRAAEWHSFVEIPAAYHPHVQFPGCFCVALISLFPEMT
jgi:hypothetical protein